MTHTYPKSLRMPGGSIPRNDSVRHKIARAMVGSTVSLIINTKTIVHGVVRGVLSDAGIPKLLVNGDHYDLDQILTVCPPSLN